MVNKKYMTDNRDQIHLLNQKLEALSKKQDDFSREINNLKVELAKLQYAENKQYSEIKESKPLRSKADFTAQIEKKEQNTTEQLRTEKEMEPSKSASSRIHTAPKIKLDLEKFIGENLINKIGILITVIGVAIGAKYSIENDLISPLTRIILGYLMALGLLGFGIKLKKNYENYSAVLLSGAIATMYFITYFAYGFYDLIPQAFAFTLMVVFTGFTVLAAINYNQQIIAHLGLVGAYGVPFLLSEGSGQVEVLFTYMALVNMGILVIAFKKYWKPLYYSAFGFTWLIYSAWFVERYSASDHLGIALGFLTVFFLVFQVTFLAYKLKRKGKFQGTDIVLLLLNAFLFYGFGFFLFSTHQSLDQFLGLLTLGNAILHFITSIIVYKQNDSDKNLLHLNVGLVFVFITLAIPVQLDGNWVTLLWVGEAALLFWIGRTKQVAIYERLSYPLMVLAFFSILQDWSALNVSSRYAHSHPDKIPVLNVDFLSSVLFTAAFGFIAFLNQSKRYTSAVSIRHWITEILRFGIPGIFLFVLYNTFRMEIMAYWNQRFIDSFLDLSQEEGNNLHSIWNYGYRNYQTVWVANYSLLFTALLSVVSWKKVKDSILGWASLILTALSIVVFLTAGLYALSELRESYISQELAAYYQRGPFHIGVRYISYLFLAGAMLACYPLVKMAKIEWKYKNLAFDFLLHTAVLWVLSSELINILDLAEFAQSYKLGLSILWGVYALFLIIWGIWKKKKHLRIGAIVLFGVTLIKLFVYDIAQLDTIAKTIVFVSLGILLLIISFLYNKYKTLIFGPDENNG